MGPYLFSLSTLKPIWSEGYRKHWPYYVPWGDLATMSSSDWQPKSKFSFLWC